jgi:hypothetical protein
MKTKNLQKLKIKCAFKSIFFLGLFFSYDANAIKFETYEKKIKTNYHVRSAIEKISRKDVEDNLRSFVAAGRPSRAFGSLGHAKIQSFLEGKLQSFNSTGTSFKILEFDPDLSKIKKQSGTEVKKAKSFVWEKKGALKPEEVLILTAHYDTILRDPKTKELILQGEMPGADNNGSGVASLLTMIEILDKLDLPKTIKIVFFDAEELGAQGSGDFIQKLNTEGQKILGILNIMMIAHDSKNFDSNQKLNNMNLYFSRAVDQSLASVIDEAGKRNYSSINFQQLSMKKQSSLPGAQTLENLSKSSFPAVLVTQSLESDLNPRHRSSNDFVETLNISTYISTFKFLTNSVLVWAYDVPK